MADSPASAADPAPAELAAGVIAEEARRRAIQAEHSEPVVLPDEVLPGVAGSAMSMRAVLRAGGVSTVLVLTLLNFADWLELGAVQTVGPDMQRSLHLSDVQLAAMTGLGALLMVLSSVPVGFLADRVRRTWLGGGLGVLAGAGTVLTGAAHSLTQLAVARLGTGLGKTAVHGVHNSLLSDRYPIHGRSRIFSLHNMANPAGGLLGPVLAGGTVALVGGAEGWRAVFPLLGVLTIVLGVATLLLREPSRGRGERAEFLGEESAAAEELPIPFGAGVRRLLMIRTMRFLLIGTAVIGFTLVAQAVFFNLILDRDFHLNTFQRGWLNTLLALGGLAGFPIGGYLGDRLFRASPPRSIILVGATTAVSGVLTAVALYLPLPGFIGLSFIAELIGGIGFVPVFTFFAAVVPYRLRALGFSLVGIYLFVFGGFLGGIAAGILSGHVGPRETLAIILPPASLISCAVVSYGARYVRRDLSMVVEEIREEKEEQARIATAGAGDVPMLQVRNLDFSYGQVQVLFDIALELGRGEVVALLGTNGAGKSTLLRAISGLAFPDRGVVRLEGRTVTYLEAEQRVKLGIVQVPGGRAVFPGLTVNENLLVGAAPIHAEPERVRAAFDRVLTLFPRLGERLGQRAGTLSGGEQQMLAVAKAMLLDPRVLLIDELSLGLAPVMTQELLEVVERLKGEGVTMLIVEQSVNLALAIADRALFMEKGEIRFEGAAADLLQRDDLVRAVFLGSAAAAPV